NTTSASNATSASASDTSANTDTPKTIAETTPADSTSGQNTSASTNNDDLETRDLARQVVTASGYAQSLRDAPASISIVDKEDILSRPIRDIGDAVQDVPGVYVEAGKTGGNTISMRGLGSAYTLILIDGKRQNVAQGFDANGFSGTFTSFMPPLSMIERIEVIRGPASVIYGSDAMGGVINIITKKHTDKTTSGMQLESRFSQHPDTFGNIFGGNAYVTTPLIKNLLSLNLRGGYRYGDQNSFRRPEGHNSTSTNPYTSHSAAGYTSWNVGGRLAWTPDSHNYLYLDSEAYYTRAGTLNTGQNQFASIRDFYKFNHILSHEADYNWGKISTYLQYSQTLWANHVQDNPYRGTGTSGAGGLYPGRVSGDSVNWAGSMRENKDIVLQTAYQNTFDFNRFGALIFNGGFYYFWENLLNRSTSFERAMNQYTVFAEGQYVINDYISTTLGLRYNYSDIFSAIPNPRFYVNVNPTNWLTLKAGVASGVIVSNLSHLYNGYTPPTTGTTYAFGNQDLLPETSWNYELSASMENRYGSLIMTGFFTDFSNQIQTLTITGSDLCTSVAGANGTCTQPRNIDRSIAAGAEVGLKVKPIYGFSMDANYAYTYTEQRSGALIGEPVNSIPQHNFTIKPEYRYKGFSAYIRWQGRFRTPTQAAGSNARSNVREVVGMWYKDYQVVDLALSYKFTKNISATFAANNIFDVNFVDYTLYDTTSNNGAVTVNGGYQNRYQRILPSRNYWLTLRIDL
ncbi:TonB-dependent receptor domain-containing protein, partial [Helicobacter sp. CLO-3]|uniref:TonB-dependent receptor domain-containing protein n=3 Tax=unclassified Helicobacter TaxID=2593540 RepID=UPI000A7E12AB